MFIIITSYYYCNFQLIINLQTYADLKHASILENKDIINIKGNKMIVFIEKIKETYKKQ